MARTGTTGAVIDTLLILLDTSYNRKSWHGANLRGSLRRVSLDQAAWRPRPGAHNIWELMLHAAYWKYAAWRRLARAAPGSFPLHGSNFFARPVEPTLRAWRADLQLLDAMHRQLRATVAATPPRTLAARLPRSAVTRVALIEGVAAHDLYHAGQIQLLKKLYTLHHRRR
jgi:hypothetical protein